MYDIIGDIHGHADKLIELLIKLGYKDQNGSWSHPTRKVISVGDLIDRGPKQREVVDIIKAMHQHGYALVIMGNHEFNAVSYYLRNQKGKPLREHSEKNKHQHAEFLKAANADKTWYEETIAWFCELPLLIETKGFRCIHAAWHDQKVNVLRESLNENLTMKPDKWEQANTEGHPLYEAIEYCLKGPEVNLPDGFFFEDKNKAKRHKVRIKWWGLHKDSTYRNSAVSVPSEGLKLLPDTGLPEALCSSSEHYKPTFFGHYWMSGQPQLLSNTIACLDWSVANDNGVLAAYRFSGETALNNENLVWVC